MKEIVIKTIPYLFLASFAIIENSFCGKSLDPAICESLRQSAHRPCYGKMVLTNNEVRDDNVAQTQAGEALKRNVRPRQSPPVVHVDHQGETITIAVSSPNKH